MRVVHLAWLVVVGILHVAVLVGSQQFVSSPGCPYIISTEEDALAEGRDPDVLGNAVFSDHLNHGRMGNHYKMVSNILRVGFCCKSKLVSLPPKDDVLAPGLFNEGTPGPRYFDFATAPGVEGSDVPACPPTINLTGEEGMRLFSLGSKRHPNHAPGLFKCVKNLPQLVGCEAAYLFPTDIDMCPSKRENNKGEEKEAGNLVIHVRSGDIFASTPAPGMGQPPLQYYVRVIEDQEWDRVDIVTNGQAGKSRVALNPVVPALEAKVASGELSANVHFHKNRSLAEDLVSMLCADAIVTAVSTTSAFFTHHSRATRMYLPHRCDAPPKHMTARPGVKVLGMVWHEGDYTVYHEGWHRTKGWQRTPEQRAEMLAFNVSGVEECSSGSDSVPFPSGA